VNSFKNAIKVHAENVDQRNKRVGGKYGQVSAVSALNSENTSKYAMFSSSGANTMENPMRAKQQELRNRRGGSNLTQHQYSTEAAPHSGEGGAANVNSNNSAYSAPPLDAPSSQNSAPLGTSSAEDVYENDKKYGKSGPPPAPATGGGGNLRGPASSGMFNRGAKASAPNR